MLDVVERNLISDIIHYNDTMGSSVVRTGDGSESLLTSSIPDLKFDRLAIVLDGSDLEINTDRTDVTLCVGIISESQEQTTLANTRVSDQEKLPKVVTKICN